MDDSNGTNTKVTLAVLNANIQTLTAVVQELKGEVGELRKCVNKEQVTSAETSAALAAVKKQLEDQDREIAALKVTMKQMEEQLEKYVPVAKVALYLASALTIPAILALFGFISGLLTHQIKIGP